MQSRYYEFIDDVSLFGGVLDRYSSDQAVRIERKSMFDRVSESVFFIIA